jgi:hypothetical protein
MCAVLPHRSTLLGHQQVQPPYHVPLSDSRFPLSKASWTGWRPFATWLTTISQRWRALVVIQPAGYGRLVEQTVSWQEAAAYRAAQAGMDDGPFWGRQR